ncbi:MAG: hypothetical protein KMY55_03955 [Dethiosulfatibacter sp.]|nr:hypothetical protein [Dethiosulfatibacter sp.]
MTITMKKIKNGNCNGGSFSNAIYNNSHECECDGDGIRYLWALGRRDNTRVD